MDNQTENSFGSRDNMKKFLLGSIEGIIDLLRTVDHPKRLEILSKMVDGQKMAFSELRDTTDLQKSALSNHLSTLVDKNLLVKREKGLYQITFDGEELLENLAQHYLNAKIREQQRLVSLLESIGKKPVYIDIEEVTMGKTNNLLKVVKLPPTKVVSFQAIGKGLGVPEPLSWKKLEEWAKPKGLFDKPGQYQIFGFNNPCPPVINEDTEYGYEFWITIPDDFEVEKGITVKEFPGGLYGVMGCRGVQELGSTWAKLAKAIEKSDYKLVKTHQWMEHHVDPRITDGNEILFELFSPISE
ncbi:MAG: effector binding domain-containing protein [Candidatus Hodarchaeales archaeon]|jgi:DNA gyrase inhibitor GyrI/DNA-binding HxlR family transcriptional regulator